ncbi:MAG: hypothetical protein ACTSX9_01370 [Candidatus Njordarchaeales archaeon]
MKETIDSILEKIFKFGDALVKLAILGFIVLIFLPLPGIYRLATGTGLILLVMYYIAFFNGLYFINKIAKIGEISDGFKLIGTGILASIVLIAYVGYSSLGMGIPYVTESIINYSGTVISVLIGSGFIFIGFGLRKLGLENKIDRIILAGNLLVILVAVELVLNIISLVVSNSILGLLLGMQIVLSLITITIFYELGVGFKELHKKLVEYASQKELIDKLEKDIKQVSNEKLDSLARERNISLMLLQILKYTA